jgi:hypothetical protein
MPGQAKDPTQGVNCNLLWTPLLQYSRSLNYWAYMARNKNRSNTQNAQYIERTQKKNNPGHRNLEIPDDQECTELKPTVQEDLCMFWVNDLAVL